ncbi:MAG: hypothetical protein JXE06_04155 [Coriobacteriia bacterium]|nr:hypothetical protein [Coriobacteriia bacterium]MBN2821777.1 hypothetical protein [Coriobacteriia bacterium]
MDVLAFNGPLALFIQGLAFALVIGALLMIIHAVRRPTSRWRFAWTRWIWVVLGAAFILSLVFALIWPSDATYTVVGFAFLGALVLEVAYLLRVVFPAPRREMPCPPVEVAVKPSVEAPVETAVEPLVETAEEPPVEAEELPVETEAEPPAEMAEVVDAATEDVPDDHVVVSDETVPDESEEE